MAIARSAAGVKKLIAEAIALRLDELRKDGLQPPEPNTSRFEVAQRRRATNTAPHCFLSRTIAEGAQVNAELLKALRKRTASACIGASTARRMGPKGTVGDARDYLAALELVDFNCETELEFQAALDRSTNGFVKRIKYWGAARKFLNIFVRDVVYNRFLCDKYGLAHTCAWLELPLDSHVARGLRDEPEGVSLTRWKTVIGLMPHESREHQDVAAKVAERIGCERIHLDLVYWRSDAQKVPQRGVNLV